MRICMAAPAELMAGWQVYGSTRRIDGRMRICMAAPAELMAGWEDVWRHQQNWWQDEKVYASISSNDSRMWKTNWCHGAWADGGNVLHESRMKKMRRRMRKWRKSPAGERMRRMRRWKNVSQGGRVRKCMEGWEDEEGSCRHEKINTVHGRQLAQALSDEGLTNRIKKRAAHAPSAIRERERNAVNSCLCKKGDFLHHSQTQRETEEGSRTHKHKFRRKHVTKILKTAFCCFGICSSLPPSADTARMATSLTSVLIFLLSVWQVETLPIL